MKNLTFKAAMLNDSRTTVNRQSTDGQSQRHCKQTPLSKRWKVLMTLVFLFTLGIGNVWAADTELCSANFNGKTAQSNSTGVAETGCTMKWGSVESSSNDVTVSGNTYRKFGSSGYVQLILDDGEFQAGDKLTVTMSSNQNNKSISYKLHDKSSGNGPSDITVSSGEAKPLSYTLTADDIESDGSIKIFRGGSANTNARYGSFSVVRPAECTETAPTSVAVSGGATYDKGDALSNLSAVVTGGTGTMSYQWYRNTTNAATISDNLKLANCTTATLTPANKVGTYYYYCVASNCAGSVTSGTTAVTINPVCPSSGTIYKFQVKTGLANGNLVTSVPKDVDMTTDNYLSALVGGELMAAARNNVNRINITGGNAIGFSNGADAYLEMTLDCAIQAGDIIKYTVASNNMLLRLTSATTAENELTLDRTKTQVEVPAAFVGATKLYMIRASSSPNISYFEVVRPVYRTITLEYADGATTDGSIKVLDGEAATKPADPTWAHHRFDGWYNGSDPYVWTANVTGNLTLTAHWTQLYTVTYAKGDESATGDAPTQVDKAAGETFEVAANSFEVAGKVFDYWNDGTNDYNPGDTYTVGTNNVTLTAVWRTPSTMYAITKGAHENGDFTIDPASQEAGEIVTLEATPNEDYVFSAWDVYKTGESSTKVSVTNNTFTMPGYAVTVNATFAADPRAKVLYVTSNTADATKENDKVYAALKDTYNVKIVGPTSDADQSTYALVVLHESVGGGNFNADAIKAAKEGNTPVLNTKSYFYNNANTDNQRWNWGTPNAGKKTKGVHVNRAYCDITSHPLFDDLTPDANDSIIILSSINGDNKPIQPIGTFTTGKEGYNLAYVPDGCAIHELTPAQRGATSGKYLMISLYSKDFANLNANGQKLFQNAAAYLIGSTAWEPKAPKTVLHTLTGVTTSSDDEVCAGVAYEATYVAESGYTLPASITVKIGGSTIDAENYTWDQSTGALTIPDAQVTGNIQITVVGDFACPAAGSGDVVFSWTPKTGLDNADIEAGTYDLPGSWLTSVNGGTAQMIVPADENMRIRGSQLAFNSNNAYVHLTICALAEGDRILVNSSNETNARNLWISLNATRPDNAEAAAAVIEQGKAYYISSTSSLKNATDLYIWRESSTTQIGEVSIIRSKKFTVTYVAADLTGGEVPAAVTDIFDGQTITVAGKGTMEKGTMLFNGWKDANEVSYAAGVDLEITANMTLTAQWSQLYSVTYAKAGTEEGTVPTQESLLNGAQFTVADQGSLVTPANKVFGGWNDGTQTYEAGETYTIAGADVTLTAVWNDTYTVQYDANGGEGTMADGTGTTVSIAANGFTYADHKFLRWNSQPDGEGTNYTVGAEVSENLTLYAIWKEVTCTPSTNIFSIEFTNSSEVKMSYNDPELDLSPYATISGGSAFMRYYNGTNTNKTVLNSSKKVNYDSNNQYLKLVLDCALQEGDVITCADGTGNQIAIAVDLTTATNPASTSNKEVTSSYEYTVQAADHIVGKDVLFLGRSTSGGTTNGTITIYRPLPDASVPTINNATPADAEYTGAASPMTVVAEVEGAEDLHYQWYKEAGETDLAVGEDAASFTPTASGEYYCVVTNSPTGYTPKSATSRTATITMISSDATLAWLKADGNDIALSDGVYAYEYTLPYNYTADGAPTVTYATTDANATITNFTPAATKTGTATINVLAQDGVTSHEYTVKFNEFSGCVRAFWFAYADDAAANNVTNNSTVFVSCPTGSSNASTYTLTIGSDVYTATRNGGSFAEAARLVIPSGFNATFYAKVRGGGSNKKITLISTADESVKYSSGTFSSNDAQVSIEDIPAGTYKLTSDGLSRLYVMAVEMCKYPMEGVSLPATESVLVGETVTLTPVFDPTNASNKNVTWESEDEDVATVANGVVTGVAAGTANITVTTEDGNFHATCAVTVTELDCDTYMGNLFALTIKDVEASITIATTEIDMATYATIENGTAFTARTSGSASHKPAVKQNNVVQFQYNNDALYLKLNLQRCALKEGDMITITGTDDNEFSFTTDATRATTYKTTGHKYVVQYGDALVGASTIYVWRAENSNCYLKSISIDRVAPSHTRPVNPAYLGTLCWTNNAAIVGATLYELQGKNENNYLVFDEVISKRLEAGKPYIFMPEDGNTEIKVYNTDDAAALTEADLQPVNNMYGTFEGKDLRPDQDEDADMYYFSGHNIWRVGDFTVEKINIPAYRCYVDYPAVLAGAPAEAPAPGRRRVTMGVNGKDVATGMENINASDKPLKVMIDGQLFIIRGEKVFDATGRLVK